MKSKIILSAIAFTAIFSVTSVSAFAATTTRSTTTMDRLSARGNAEITARIESLNKLEVRIQGMKRLTDAQKAYFATTVQTQIASLNDLLTKMKADTSTTTLRTDLKTIAPTYRIYMLVEPQLAILAAADRANTLTGMLATLGTKLDARLAAHPNATASAKLTDLKAKIADANIQAQAAIDLVINLRPDQGNQTVMQSNQTALKDARAKIHAANQDIKDAYADAKAIIQTLKASGDVTASSSASLRQQ
jgi:hypothetical protein